MTTLALFCVRAYQLLLRPLLPPSCRFSPSCSEYAADALRRHGFIKAAPLAARRLFRCHPFTDGGHDPIPDNP